MYTETEHGCWDRDTLEIGIVEDIKIFVPNAFSPNGDGLNDCFSVGGTTGDIIEVFRIIIYSRWGWRDELPTSPGSSAGLACRTGEINYPVFLPLKRSGFGRASGPKHVLRQKCFPASNNSRKHPACSALPLQLFNADRLGEGKIWRLSPRLLHERF